MTEKKVLILGASGYVGTRLIAMLLEKGYSVRAAARRPAALKDKPWAQHPHVEFVSADAFERESLKQACSGCAAAYYLIHSMNPSVKDFADADRQAANNMIWAAEQGGLERVLYLGGLGDEASNLSKHLRSRAEVGHILSSGKVPATILRAAVILGTGSASFEILRYLVMRLPVMVTPRWVDTESQPIAIRNILNYLAGCLQEPATIGQVYDVGGPDILSYRQLMEIFAEEAKRRRPIIIPVPFFTPHLSSYWIGFITPVSAALARPLAEGLVNRVVCQDQRIQKLIPQQLIGCREAIRRALAPEQYEAVRKGQDPHKSPPYEWRYPGEPEWVGGKPRLKA